MKSSSLPILLFFLLIIITPNYAQEGLKQEISIRNFKLLENESDFFSGEKGLKCTFQARFTEIIKEFSKQDYSLTWRLENSEGKVVFRSEDATGFSNQKESIRAEAPFSNSSASYGEDDGEIFITYTDLNLPNGKNDYKLVLSATHDAKKFPDFWSKTISFSYKKITIQPSDKQVFTLKNLKTSTSDFIGQKLEINYTLHLAYGPGEIEDKDYQTTWQLLDANGKEIYNAEQDFFTKDKKIYLSAYKADTKNGGFVNEEFTKVEYKYLKLSGNQTLTFVLYIIQKGERKKIHEEKINVVLTEFHPYKDQAFTISNLLAKPSVENGVSGIKVSFDCKFKFHQIAEGSGEDHDFYFYVNFLSSGKEIYSIGKDNPYKRSAECAIMDYRTLSKASTGSTFSKSLFVPYFLLNATAGSYNLELSLLVSNSTGSIRFNELGKTTTKCTKPKTIKVSFDLTKLTLVDKEYDAAFGSNYNNRKSDTQWFIATGNYDLYIGEVNDNANEGIEDKVDFTISEGDELQLIIIDKDKLFNPNDVLARIPLAVENKTVTGYKKGDIEGLNYKIVVESPK